MPSLAVSLPATTDLRVDVNASTPEEAAELARRQADSYLRCLPLWDHLETPVYVDAELLEDAPSVVELPEADHS